MISSTVNLSLTVQILERGHIIDQLSLQNDSSRIRCLLLIQSVLAGRTEEGQSHGLPSTLAKLGEGELIYEKGAIGESSTAKPAFTDLENNL